MTRCARSSERTTDLFRSANRPRAIWFTAIRPMQTRKTSDSRAKAVMTCCAVFVAAAAAVPLADITQAQEGSASGARVRSLLENNFDIGSRQAAPRARPRFRSLAPPPTGESADRTDGPVSRGRLSGAPSRGPSPGKNRPAQPPPQTVEKPDELLIIRPGGKIKRVPLRKGPGQRSDYRGDGRRLATVDNDQQPPGDNAGLWSYLRSLWQPTAPGRTGSSLLHAGAGENPRSALHASKPEPGAVPPGGPTDVRNPASVRRMAEASGARTKSKSAFGVVPDVYILHFKDTATLAQMKNVIDKYNLEVVGKMPALQTVFVKRRTPRTRSAAPPTRSALPRSRGFAAPPASDESAGQSARRGDVQSVLNPPFLQALRREPGINAATVHSTIAPNFTPPPTDTTVKDGARTYSWTWRPGVADDGNWGLKRMRMPPVWHILKHYRRRYPSRAPTTMSFLDSGFSWHDHLTYRVVHGLRPGDRLLFAGASCGESHGTHVAGIAGAAHGRGRGIDGIVPGARIDAIPLQADDVLHAMTEGVHGVEGHNTMLFITAAKHLVQYLEQNPPAEGGKRVVNVSLGFNWAALSGDATTSSGTTIEAGQLVDEHKKSVVLSFASMLQAWLKRFEHNTLFVVAAGNDSEGRDPPLDAKWSSPFSYLGSAHSGTFAGAPNFLVVEAADRTGRRASFSNGGGHVAAPGVDIMSTVGSRTSAYAICDGTSQAAPHVSALAAILMELAPEKSPAEIAATIRQTGVPDSTGRTANRVDALEATLKVAPDGLTILADLNSDGLIDSGDLRTFHRHRQAMTTVFLSTFGSYFFDLNLNGRVEDNEHWYPRIDLNGSGRASFRATDQRCLGGKPVSDLDVIRQAWKATGNRQDFAAAARATKAIDEAQQLLATQPRRNGAGWAADTVAAAAARPLVPRTTGAANAPAMCNW